MTRRTIPDDTVDGLRRRLRDLERGLEDERRVRPPATYREVRPTPLVFHWNGQVSRFLNVRSGPGEFGVDGPISKIRYRWDAPPAASATVQWWLDSTNVGTHTLPASTDPHVVLPGWTYAQEAIVAIVTAAGSDALGLSAFVYLGS